MTVLQYFWTVYKILLKKIYNIVQKLYKLILFKIVQKCNLKIDEKSMEITKLNWKLYKIEYDINKLTRQTIFFESIELNTNFRWRFPPFQSLLSKQRFHQFEPKIDKQFYLNKIMLISSESLENGRKVVCDITIKRKQKKM